MIVGSISVAKCTLCISFFISKFFSCILSKPLVVGDRDKKFQCSVLF